jgi:hypothetical protein
VSSETTQEMEVGREVWYRVVDGRYAGSVDECGDPMGDGGAYVRVDEYPVLRHTPKGVWLEHAGRYGQHRFVLRVANKRWACPTKEEAMESFRARKQRQAKILRAQLAHVKEALALI